MIPLYPRWYDANARYDYHFRAKRHFIENCLALKHKVQALKKVGYVNFDYNKIDGPNVTIYPLSNHLGPKINALTEDSIGLVKT